MSAGLLLGAALLLTGALAPCAGAASTAAESDSSRFARADRLHRAAEARLVRGGIEERRMALQELEQAALLAPDDPRHQQAYGQLCLEAGFDRQARAAFERAIALAPGAAAAHVGLARVWKRDWLACVDSTSLENAVDHLEAAVRLDPETCAGWALLAPLLYERGRLSEARAAAERACAARGDCPEARLAAAYLSYRSGRSARAESLFAAALPLLPRAFAARFYDLTPLVTPETGEALADMSPSARREFERRFWSQADPDLSTPENEARLEYWSRIAHAGLVFLDEPNEFHWDTRAELYVRYGSPRGVRYQPPGLPLFYQMGKYGSYPIHNQLWDYSHLGMLVPLYDYLLTKDYKLTRTRAGSPDPVPDARVLERRDLIATPGGRALFPALPPGVKPLPVEGRLVRFEGERGTKLLAQIEVPGTPVDSLWAQCALVDSSEHVVARLARTLSPSGCDPTALRTGDFSFDVAPGAYRAAFTVRDGHGARGVTRVTQEVAPVPAGLSLSDVVVVCGPIDVSPGAPEVRLGPNLKARVSGEGPLIAYFEIYRFTPGADGLAHFDYEYAVESEEKEARPWYRRLLPFGADGPHYVVRSEETNVGPLRRQFITVPVQSLKPGRYRLEVRVRDLTTGAVTTASARFERTGGKGSGA